MKRNNGLICYNIRTGNKDVKFGKLLKENHLHFLYSKYCYFLCLCFTGRKQILLFICITISELAFDIWMSFHTETFRSQNFKMV